MSQSFISTQATNLDNTFQNFQEQQMQEIVEQIQKKLSIFQKSTGYTSQKHKMITNQLSTFQESISDKYVQTQDKKKKLLLENVFRVTMQTLQQIRVFFMIQQSQQQLLRQYFIGSFISIKFGKINHRIQMTKLQLNSQEITQIQQTLKKILNYISMFRQKQMQKKRKQQQNANQADTRTEINNNTMEGFIQKKQDKGKTNIETSINKKNQPSQNSQQSQIEEKEQN